MKRKILILALAGLLSAATPARACGWYLMVPPQMIDYQCKYSWLAWANNKLFADAEEKCESTYVRLMFEQDTHDGILPPPQQRTLERYEEVAKYAPLKWWRVNKAYDSADECENAAAAARKQGQDNYVRRLAADNGPSSKVVNTYPDFFAQCVATDDPRLAR